MVTDTLDHRLGLTAGLLVGVDLVAAEVRLPQPPAVALDTRELGDGDVLDLNDDDAPLGIEQEQIGFVQLLLAGVERVLPEADRLAFPEGRSERVHDLQLAVLTRRAGTLCDNEFSHPL